MSYENPTPLQVGASGTLNGWRVRVAGRIVMGVQEAGETYFWSEYYLLDDSGNSATLVFEETEAGPEWKLFREFTPTRPITAKEAAAKRVGDTVDLDGTPTPITLTGTSRVFHIEGSAPEGVENGDIASYFNADTGNRMLVASWTGDEIEFYEGLDAPAHAVADAFGFARPAAQSPASFFRSGASPTISSGVAIKVVMAVLGLVVLFGVYSCWTGRRPIRIGSSTPPIRPAPAIELPLGARGSLAQHAYTIERHTRVEVARTSGRHQRREYALRDDAKETAFLINGLNGSTQEWHLLRASAAPLPALTPFDAAMKRKGTSVNVEGQVLRIVDLFQWKPVSAGSTSATSGATTPASIEYGFVARDGAEWLVARWSENGIQFLRGPAVPEAEVLAAFRSR